MKRAVIVALVCLNAALAAALALGVGTPAANAQDRLIGARTDYLVMTGKTGSNFDSVWIIDLKKQAMVAMEFDKTHKEMRPYRGMKLKFQKAGG
jgi:hypothetical protein